MADHIESPSRRTVLLGAAGLAAVGAFNGSASAASDRDANLALLDRARTLGAAYPVLRQEYREADWWSPVPCYGGGYACRRAERGAPDVRMHRISDAAAARQQKLVMDAFRAFKRLEAELNAAILEVCFDGTPPVPFMMQLSGRDSETMRLLGKTTN